MRITFLSPTFDMSGGQRAIAIYAQKLQDRGHEVVVISPPLPRRSLRSLAREIVKGRRLPRRIVRGPSHFDEVTVDRRVIDRHRPIRDSDVPDADVVIGTWWETAEWVAALSPAKGTKVHFMQDYEVWGGSRERVDAITRHPMPKIIAAPWVGDLLREKFRFEDFSIVPYGVDAKLFHAPPRGKQPRPTVGLTYTTFHNKGTDISLKAYEIARREVPDLKLVMFGSIQPSAELPAPPGSEFHHRVPNEALKEIYSRCDAWLFGTRIEGYGLPIMEAMACRTPVIGTPAGAAPMMLSGGGGVLIPHEDPEAMARAILDFVKMGEDQWLQMSDAALATALRFNWDDSATLFEAALLKAVEKQPVAGTGQREG